ncbi:MAG: OmpA family protein [Desulfomonilaceae bacterium]
MYKLLIPMLIFMMASVPCSASAVKKSKDSESLKAAGEASAPIPKSVSTLVPKDMVIKKLKADCQVTYSSDALLFRYGKAELKPESYTNLKSMADALLAVENDPELSQIRHYYVDGHTCSLGGVEFNCKLSWARANAVVDHLVKLGVPKEKLIPRGFGFAYPVYPNDREETRMLNRRVVLKGECPNPKVRHDPVPCRLPDHGRNWPAKEPETSFQPPSLDEVAGLKTGKKANGKTGSEDLLRDFTETRDPSLPKSVPLDVGSKSLPRGFIRTK